MERIIGVPVTALSVSLPEIQAGSLEEIARFKLARALEVGPTPIAIEDVSLELVGLGGFPGPYVKWLLESSGGEGLARVAGGLDDPSAIARCCVAWSNGREERLFVGETPGAILPIPRGNSRFGWDPWFLPDGRTRTYAEMDADEKDSISHRGLAWRKLSTFLGSQ